MLIALRRFIDSMAGRIFMVLIVGIAAAALVDRSGGTAELGVPFHPLISLSFPTYAPDDVPADLATTPAIKPGSRTTGA